MSITNYTFTEDAVAEDFLQEGRYTQLSIGSTDAEDFGGGNLLIQKRTQAGGIHTIRTVTAAQFTAMRDKTVRIELPAQTEIILELNGSATPNLYVETSPQDNYR